MPFVATAKFPGAVAGVSDLLNQKNVFQSNPLTTLGQNIASGSDTTIYVTTGTGQYLPSDNFVISIDDEIIFVSSRSVDTLTAGTRGYEGTTATTHGVGTQVTARITALAHNQLAVEVNAIETALGVNLANVVLPARQVSTSSPLTGGGDLSANRTISFVNQSANKILAGPTSGGDAAPAFRALVDADMPTDVALKAAIQDSAYTYSSDSGTANTYAVTLTPAPTVQAGLGVIFLAAHTNTGASTLSVNGAAGVAIKKLNGTTALAAEDITAGQIVTVVYDGTYYQLQSPPGTTSSTTGTVTSVALSMPAEFSVSGSPITSSGTFTVTKATENANKVFAGPTSGGDSAPTFRSLVSADMPSSGAGSGTVTSAALSMPAEFSVSGSPITSSGTFTVTKAVENANKVFAGPTSGGDAAPTFRTLVNADMPASGAGSGTVTSVGLSMPAEFSVSGSPVTASGTFTVTKAVENANKVFAGPTSGGDAAPTFRTLVNADMPASGAGSGSVTSAALSMPAEFSVSGSPITSSGTFTVTKAVENANKVFAGPTTGADAAPTFRALVSADMPSSGAGSGTVTSVGLSMPAEFSVANSPVTGSGTLTVTKAVENANKVFAGPTSGGDAAPTFRSLVGADLPNPSASTLGGVESIVQSAHNWVQYIDTSGVPHLAQPASSDLSDSSSLATRVGIQNQSYDYASDSGTANSYVVTLSPAPASLTAGLYVSFKAGNANTGPSTLDVNALGPVLIKKLGSSQGLVSGDIGAGDAVNAVYDGTYFQMLSPPRCGNTTRFSPSSVTGLVAWYDASQITGIENGGSIQTWKDLSGNGWDLTQSTSAKRPTLSQNYANGLPSVAFNGSQWMQTASTSWTKPISIFAIAIDPTASSAAAYLIDSYTASGGPHFARLYFNGSSQFEIFGGAEMLASCTNNLSLFEGIFNGASSVIGVNGTTSTGNTGTAGPATYMYVGCSYAAGVMLTGNICEILVFEAALSDANRQLVEGYLAWKWGLQTSLPSTHPYYSVNPYAPATITQANIQNDTFSYADDFGTANTYKVSLSPAPLAYTEGMKVKFKAKNANTGASTLAVNGLAATNIYKSNGSTGLASGDISAGQVVTVVYDGTYFQVESFATATGAQGDKAGLRYYFDTTTTAGTSGNGDLRFNNATIASVTAIYLDYHDVNGVDLHSYFAKWADSGSTIKGYIIVKENSNAGTPFSVFSLTAVTDNTTYYTLTVTYVAGTKPANNDAIVVEWLRTGDVGSVSSVGLSMPAEFSVANSPITSSGTLTVTKANESANQVYAGPTSGGAAAPAFRALVTGDIPVGGGHVAGYTETDITWGSPTTILSLTNDFPSNQTFSGFKKIRIRWTANLVASNTYHHMDLSKDGSNSYGLACAIASNSAEACWIQRGYATNQWSTILGNWSSPVFTYGWNYFELSITVMGASSNILTMACNGAYYSVAPVYVHDTNIDLSTGTFTLYMWEGTIGGPPNPGDSTNRIGTCVVETWS